MQTNANMTQLKETLKKLEKSSKKIVETRGYTEEVARLRTLEELIKEQFKNENSRYSARTPR